jgi:hypothetical protein
MNKSLKNVLILVAILGSLLILVVIGEHQDDATRQSSIRNVRGYFANNRQQVLAEIRSALVHGPLHTADSLCEKYSITGDTELRRLHNDVKTAIFLAQLNEIPVEKYSQNLELYQQLVNLNPDSARFKTKLQFYSQKAERDTKISRQFSVWDGDHIELKEVIKASMHDPDSYKHVGTVYWDKGDYLIVRTTFRGTNAFGAVVTNSVTAKVSIDGQVLSIIDG